MGEEGNERTRASRPDQLNVFFITKHKRDGGGGLQHSLTGTTGTSTPPWGGRRGVWAEEKRITPEWWGRAADSREAQAWRRPEWQRRRRETRAFPAHTRLTLNSATTPDWETEKLVFQRVCNISLNTTCTLISTSCTCWTFQPVQGFYFYFLLELIEYNNQKPTQIAT